MIKKFNEFLLSNLWIIKLCLAMTTIVFIVDLVMIVKTIKSHNREFLIFISYGLSLIGIFLMFLDVLIRN